MTDTQDDRELSTYSHAQDGDQIAIYRNGQPVYFVRDVAQQEPVQADATVQDNSQDWCGMGGDIAFQLIERHANGWADIKRMMDEWLSANQEHRPIREVIGYIKQYDRTPGPWSIDPHYLPGAEEPTGYNATYKAVQYAIKKANP